MLVVTFGRAASQELRERVRAQLVEAERVLSDDPAARAALAPGPPSELVVLLQGWDDERRRAGHRRVTEALAGFDAATIATTHQFCSMVLDSLGVAGDSDSRARLVEDLDDLVKETVDDLYLRAFAFDEGGAVFSYGEALAIARAAVKDPQARLEPEGEDRTTPVGRRVSFARAVRKELDRRKRRLGILSYDDLLSQLRDALHGPRRCRGRADAAALADRAGRRVPGHRPRAVGRPAPRVQRPRHDGADRRPEAGDLRLPRRRRRHLPRRRRDRDDQADALGQLAQRRCAGRGVRGAAGRGRARRPADRRTPGRGAPRRQPAGRRATAGTAAGSGGAAPGPRQAVRRPDGQGGAAADRRGPRSRRTPPARVGRDVRGAGAAAPRHRGDLLPARRPGRRPPGVAGGRRARRDRRWRQRLRDARGGRVADPARGTGAAAPQRPGAVRGADLLLRPHRRGARRRGRRPHRRRGRDAARLGRAVHDPRHGGGARGGHRRRAAGAGARRGRRRPAAHRPAPHRRGAARGDAHRATRPGLPADLAARAGRRGEGGARPRAHPPARLRRRRGPARHHPRQQGAGVPRRLPARDRRPVRGRPEAAAVPRRRGPALPQRRRRGRRLGRPLPPLVRRGGGGVAAAALRRGHPGQVAGGVLVGADQERPRLPAAPPADARRGHQHGRAGAAAAERRRGGRAVRALARARRPGARACAPSRPRRRPAGARDARPRPCAASPAPSTRPGGARRTPP